MDIRLKPMARWSPNLSTRKKEKKEWKNDKKKRWKSERKVKEK